MKVEELKWDLSPKFSTENKINKGRKSHPGEFYCPIFHAVILQDSDCKIYFKRSLHKYIHITYKTETVEDNRVLHARWKQKSVHQIASRIRQSDNWLFHRVGEGIGALHSSSQLYQTIDSLKSSSLSLPSSTPL